MHAIVNDRYGPPDVLGVRDIDQPTLTDDGVLVRVHATSINAFDWHTMRGKPYIARLDGGLRRPKTHVLGLDVAGVVEAAGPAVVGLKVGDRVFGSRLGAFAEYVNGRNFVPMPTTLTFEEAAAVPTAGLTALQGLRDKGGIQPGQRVLINGAGGGVGTFAVQIAKSFGADVTATTSTANLDLIHSLGADTVIDHTRDDVTKGSSRFDLILDCGGNHSLAKLRRVLTPTGTIVIVAPGPGQMDRSDRPHRRRDRSVSPLEPEIASLPRPRRARRPDGPSAADRHRQGATRDRPNLRTARRPGRHPVC